MPFSFQLLLEFFLPGMVLFCSVVLLADLFYPAEVAATLAFLTSAHSTGVIVVVFVIGLVCYFLGTVANAVSNGLIRKCMAPYRRRIIRRKLGLKRRKGIIRDLDPSELVVIETFLTRIRSQSPKDALNEVYAAARTFCSLWSERSANTIGYHWALMRLARATLLPLIVLCGVFFLRQELHPAQIANHSGLYASLILLSLTFLTYCYREKFLIYTVFDTFFLIAKRKDTKGNGA